ncbi:MAG: SpoIID/LytB domain-containing protein [Longimicrobiales bacterium]
MKRILTAWLAVVLAGCTPGEKLGAPEPGATPTRPTTPTAPPTSSTRLPALPDTEPDVRVGITIDSTRTSIGAAVEFDVQSVNGRVLASAGAGEIWQFEAKEDGRITARYNDRNVLDAPPPVRVVPRDLPFVTIDGRQYRGEVLLLSTGTKKVTAINIVDMEAYLLGVVPREMGKRPATEIEALKAQAVAARTYAIGNMGGHENKGFDFYATVLDQVYGGTADEDSIVSRAVRETRGRIISHQGRPILAYYASTCGGTTAAIEESWPTRAALPYLRSRSDRIPGTDDDYYCKTSNRFNWKTEWTRQQLLDVLGTTLRTHTRGSVTSVASVDDVQITSRGPSGRATLDLKVDGRTYTLRADSIRWVLRPTPAGGILNSSRLYNVSTTRNGTVDHLTIEGGGWGHAIGMCQVGAMARARAGHSYTDILKAYYSDVTIASLY